MIILAKREFSSLSVSCNGRGRCNNNTNNNNNNNREFIERFQGDSKHVLTKKNM